MDAEVLVVVVVVGCVQGSWSQVTTITTETIFKNLCYNTD